MKTTYCKVGKTLPLTDYVDSYLLSTNQQDSQKYYASYISFAKRVYNDLHFDVLTSERKLIIPIDKKLNTITLPDDVLYWQQISVIDDEDNDNVIPVLENDMTLLPYKEEVVPIACANPKCKSDLCASVKAISSVGEVVKYDFPDPDTEYTNVTRTQVWPDGSIIKEVCQWFPIIVDGSIDSVEKKCSTIQVCKVALTEDECIADTVENKEVITRCCLTNNTCCNPKKVVPTINLNDGIVYFSNGNFDRVLLTYKTSGIYFGIEIQVPEMAEEAMISGIAYYALKHKRVSEGEKENARKIYNIDKNKLTSRLNPIREQEFVNAARIKKIVF